MSDWKPTNPIPGPSRPAPVVHLGPPPLFLNEIAFEVHQATIFKNASEHEVLDAKTGRVLADLKNLDGFARGSEIVEPEWREDRTNNFPVCLLRNKPVDLKVRLRWPTKAGIKGKLTVVPKLEGAAALHPKSVEFEIAAGSDTTAVSMRLTGNMPNEIGRYRLLLEWKAEVVSPAAAFSFVDVRTEHFVFTRFAEPLVPGFDSSQEQEQGRRTGDGSTRTGTPKRLDKLTSLLGATRRHPCADADDLQELLWRVHVGINDGAGAPFFDAIHNEHLTHNGDKEKVFIPEDHKFIGTGFPLALQDQWLMWVNTPAPRWNTASCIGHVQLMKTMLAAIGIFTRRAWILPKTPVMPDGSRVRLAEDDIYCLGDFSTARQQSHEFIVDGKTKTARVRLMEPNAGYENFEACVRTPGGRLLPGGYSTAGVEKDHPGFIANRGFRSALEVLRWWCSTKRGSFQRFMCWVHVDAEGKATDCWDRDGKHYPIAEYTKILQTKKHLLPPTDLATPLPKSEVEAFA